MKIGITQLLLGNMSLDDILGLCLDAGYEAIELTFGEGTELDIDMSPSEIARIGEKCAVAGIEISSTIANYGEGGNLLSLDPNQQEKRIRSVNRSLEIAGILEVDTILLHPGQLTVEGTYQAVWDNLRDILKGLAPVAASNGAAIGLENVWSKFLLSSKETREFIDAVGSDWIGVYLDTANMMAYGFPEHWIRELGTRIKCVHFKDFRRGEHQFVNLLDGNTDWPTVMREFRTIGYDRYVIHEVGGDRAAQIDIAKRMRRIIGM